LYKESGIKVKEHQIFWAISGRGRLAISGLHAMMKPCGRRHDGLVGPKQAEAGGAGLGNSAAAEMAQPDSVPGPHRAMVGAAIVAVTGFGGFAGGGDCGAAASAGGVEDGRELPDYRCRS